MIIIHPPFYLFLYLAGVQFQGELQYGGNVSQQKMSVDQSDVPYVSTAYPGPIQGLRGSC